jgi:hypothetical protein
MNVVGPVLRVVVFDQEAGTLQPVVVRLTALESACPGEVDLLQRRPRDPLGLDCGDLAGQAIEVLVDEGQEQLPLLRRHVGRSQPLGPAVVAHRSQLLVRCPKLLLIGGVLRLHSVYLRLGQRNAHELPPGPWQRTGLNDRSIGLDDVDRRHGREHGPGPLVGSQRVEELAAQVLLSGQRSQHAGADQGR